jgi:hypothetical protein
MNNFISIVNNFNLVIYTDENSSKYIDTRENTRIKIIIKPIEDFYTYKYKDFWIQNHEKNDLLKHRIEWYVNMLWSEKIWFVNDTIQNQYFETEFYGWCDIGYFRNNHFDMHTNNLSTWANDKKINMLDRNKIYYAVINNSRSYMNYLNKIVNDKNEIGLPIQPIPNDQLSIAGGFFMLHKEKIDWWCNTFENKLKLYFENNYLVKDDQIILLDCILSNNTKNEFNIIKEMDPRFDNWFLFQRFLL